MYKLIDRKAGRVKRHRRSRVELAGSAQRPRLAVYRSLRHISAQVIDDARGVTLAAAATNESQLRSGLKGTANRDAATAVGRAIAERAQKAGITTVVFDRGGNPYHGRIKAVAEAARAAGLKF
jgi:large subunit ribosomal protein L18